MKINRLSLFSLAAATAAVLGLVIPNHVTAQCAMSCPGYSLPLEPNLLHNADFEVSDCNGFTVLSQNIASCGIRSAAAGWYVHGDNAGDTVRTYYLTPSDLPIGGKSAMLHILAAGGESGVYQPLPSGLTKVTASVWVRVKAGRVVLQVHGSNMGPSAWSTKTNEWELLRICTDGSVPVNTFVVYNEDPNLGDFYVDRAELKTIQ